LVKIIKSIATGQPKLAAKVRCESEAPGVGRGLKTGCTSHAKPESAAGEGKRNAQRNIFMAYKDSKVSSIVFVEEEKNINPST
jgi:hypothetical protein